MPSYNNLDTLSEQACAALLALASVNSYYGLEYDTRTLPSAICQAEGGEEMPLGSGNFWQRMSIRYISAGTGSSSDLTAHQTGAAAAFDVFLTDTIIADLTGVQSNFGVIGFKNRNIAPTQVEDRKWISEMTFDILVCATDL